MVNGSGGKRWGGGDGRRGPGEPSTFLKYQTDTFSLDADDHKRGEKKMENLPRKSLREITVNGRLSSQ